MRSQCIITQNSIWVNDELIFSVKPCEDLDSFLIKAYRNLEISYPKFHKMDKISKLGILTASLVFNEFQGIHEPFTTGIVLCSKSGCQFTDQFYIQGLESKNTDSNPTLFTYTLPSIVMGEICIKHDIKGENSYLMLDEFNQALIGQITSNMFTNKGMKKCLVGWIELETETKYKSHFYFETKVSFKEKLRLDKLQFARQEA